MKNSKRSQLNVPSLSKDAKDYESFRITKITVVVIYKRPTAKYLLCKGSRIKTVTDDKNVIILTSS